MKKLLFFLLFFSVVAFGQITIIPDSNFEQALVDQGIDSDGVINGQVLTSDVENVITLFIMNYLITDLTGIEDFASLEFLHCGNNSIQNVSFAGVVNLKTLVLQQNPLVSIDVSSNLLLEGLYLGNPDIDVLPFPPIASLDLSSNINLIELDCPACTSLTNLDVTNNTNLKYLNVWFCDLYSLDLSNNSLLETLIIGEYSPFTIAVSNNLTMVDVSQNPNLEYLAVVRTGIEELNVKNGANSLLAYMNATLNPNLSCIQVDDEIAAGNGDFPYSGWGVDNGVIYSEDCSLGVSNNEIETNIIVYPNPVKDILTIDNTNNTEITSIKLYDVLGKLVLHVESNYNQIDVSGLNRGIFFLNIETDRGVVTKKIIKE